jgi:hypothetical protein
MNYFSHEPTFRRSLATQGFWDKKSFPRLIIKLFMMPASLLLQASYLSSELFRQYSLELS